jgi:2',3'-cyclic-nucleotide 2'-phosphodiesterase (5'-nucleotidase family)
MRQKRNSSVLVKAEQRATAISSIDIDLDLGNGLTLSAYWKSISNLREKHQQYNAMLSNLDELYSALKDEERAVREMSEHMLSGVKVRFGRDSYEYEKAGGVRRSERKRPQPRAKAA